MKITQNDEGQSVYHLASIVDIMLLPHHMAEHALEVLPMLVWSTRAAIAAAEADGRKDEFIAILPDTLELVDDGRHRIVMGVDGVAVLSAEMKDGEESA